MATTLFEELISNKDILDRVMYEWIDTKDLLKLDSAVVDTASRTKFHTALSQARYRVPFENSLENWWKNHENILDWVIARKMYTSEGVWHVNQKLWEILIGDPKYSALLASIRGIRFENFSTSSALEGLDRCVNLNRLEICNLTDPKANPTPLNLPNLEELFVQNSQINADFTHIFGNTPKLTSLELLHVRYVDIPAEAAQTFINRFTKVDVIGDLDNFLSKLIRGPTRLQDVHIDKLHKAEPHPMDLKAFLEMIPDVRVLSVDRMRLHIPSFFKCLTAYNPHLRHLHLNHIRIMDTPSPVPAENINLAFSSLQISSLLPATNEETLKILEHTKTVTQLTLSMMNKLDHEGFQKIHAMRRYHSVEIQERKAYLSDDPAMINDIKTIFHDTPKLKIVEWPEWKAEIEKPTCPELATVLFERV